MVRSQLPFADGEPAALICDSEEIAAAARALGWPDVRCPDEMSKGTAVNCLLLASREETLFDVRLRPALQGARTIYLGLQAFDPSLTAATYTLDVLRRCDFHSAVQRNRRWVRLLERRQELRFRSGPPGTASLLCVPASDILAGTLLSCAIEAGSVVSAGAFFEVELEGFGDTARPFQVNGDLVVDGVLFALADDFTGSRAAARARGQRVFSAAQGGVCLRIRENRVIACCRHDGRSILSEVAAAVDGNLTLTEFAIGTNQLRAPDFTVNAQMNEGAGGIHVGLGGGEQGLHLDFIAPRATLQQDDAVCG